MWNGTLTWIECWKRDKSMTVSSGIFDINSNEDFFHSLQRMASKLRLDKVKKTEELLYLLMGVNHLREWIAPGVRWFDKNFFPQTPGEIFGVAIYSLEEFKIVNAVCNRSKHLKHIKYQLETEYGAMFDDYPEIDSVNDIDNGPPCNYYVDDRNLLDIIDVILNYYETNWYCRSESNR